MCAAPLRAAAHPFPVNATLVTDMPASALPLAAVAAWFHAVAALANLPLAEFAFCHLAAAHCHHAVHVASFPAAALYPASASLVTDMPASAHPGAQHATCCRAVAVPAGHHAECAF